MIERKREKVGRERSEKEKDIEYVKCKGRESKEREGEEKEKRERLTVGEMQWERKKRSLVRQGVDRRKLFCF